MIPFKVRGVDNNLMDRNSQPDLMPRRSDPFSVSPGAIPGAAPPPSQYQIDPAGQPAQNDNDIYKGWYTQPGSRPLVFQRGFNYQFNATTVPQPMLNATFQCDSMILNVPSTAGASVFWGYGAQITTGSGLEIQPGLPIIIEPENTRELWELQRMLELMAAMLADQIGLDAPGPYRAPRVAFNATEWYIVAAGPVSMSIVLFNHAEGQ